MNRTRRVERWWGRYAGSIAFVALVLIAALGFARIENARFEGCEGGNLLRAGLRAIERQEIRTREATDPALFPDIPPPIFEQLIDERNDESRTRIRENFAPRDCGTRVDLPLTGAYIVLPP